MQEDKEINEVLENAETKLAESTIDVNVEVVTPVEELVIETVITSAPSINEVIKSDYVVDELTTKTVKVSGKIYDINKAQHKVLFNGDFTILNEIIK